MVSTILDGVKGLKKTFNLYAMTLGVFGLGLVIRWLNKEFNLKQEEMKIFDFVVYPEYISAIIGLLFCLFVVVLFFQIRLVFSGLKAARLGQSALETEIPESLQHFPWIACPLHESKLGPILFGLLLAVGCIILAVVSISHINGEATSNPTAFKAIGYVDLAILIGGSILLWRIGLYLVRIRRLLQDSKGGGV